MNLCVTGVARRFLRLCYLDHCIAPVMRFPSMPLTVLLADFIPVSVWNENGVVWELERGSM